MAVSPYGARWMPKVTCRRFEVVRDTAGCSCRDVVPEDQAGPRLGGLPDLMSRPRATGRSRGAISPPRSTCRLVKQSVGWAIISRRGSCRVEAAAQRAA